MEGKREGRVEEGMERQKKVEKREGGGERESNMKDGNTSGGTCDVLCTHYIVHRS